MEFVSLGNINRNRQRSLLEKTDKFHQRVTMASLWTLCTQQSMKQAPFFRRRVALSSPSDVILSFSCLSISHCSRLQKLHMPIWEKAVKSMMPSAIDVGGSLCNHRALIDTLSLCHSPVCSMILWLRRSLWIMLHFQCVSEPFLVKMTKISQNYGCRYWYQTS